MKIDKKTIIFGIPIIKIRDFMRKYRTPGSFSLHTITEYFDLTKASGAYLLNELLNSEYAEQTKPNEYKVTVKGNSCSAYSEFNNSLSK